MLKKIIICLFIILLTACSNEKKVEVDSEKGEYKSLNIKVNITNPESKDDKYLVFLLPPGVKETEPGEATQSGYYGPIETDENGEANLDLGMNWDMDYYIEQSNKLELVVTTTEDIYMRNPLNKKTIVEFSKNEDKETNLDYKYYSNIPNIVVDIVDKYPDGVLSLTFPDATFVIKLEFNSETKKSYEVSIHKPSDTGDGISAIRTGRIAREFQYYDTPFFKDDKLQNWDGTIVIRDFDTNEVVNYEGYPKSITFDDNGKCEQGDIIKIRMP